MACVPRKEPKCELNDVLDRLGADVIHVGVFDYASMFRERRLRRAEFIETAGTAVFGNVLPKWDTGENILAPGPYRSESVAIDPGSARPYPFEPAAAAFVADFDGPQKELMPRHILKTQIAAVERAGFMIEAAFEFEFIILQESADTLRSKGFSNPSLFAPDNRCWSGQTAATFAPFISDLEALLLKADIGLHSLSVELGPGCLEATLRHRPALRAADDAAFFRMFTKAFCRQRDLTASFMAHTGHGFPSIGGHVCVSLKDKSGRNVFADPSDEHGLSQTAKSFMAGVIEIVPDAFPMCAHTVNAYRRLAPGSWAPKTMSWAPYNYAAAIRTAAETPERTRLELRLPGSDCNPYLTLAMLLGTGLDGVTRKLELKDPPISSGGPSEIPKGVPRLPTDLLDATQRFERSKKSRALFGAAFVDHFAMICTAEDASLRRAVSAEEVKRYLEAG
jgi:glutamine synthetase